MNSPAAGLLWEMWRRYRWGVALLLVLLACCVIASRHVARLQGQLTQLESKLYGAVSGAELAAPELLDVPSSAFQLQVDGVTFYSGPFSTMDGLSWDGSTITIHRGNEQQRIPVPDHLGKTLTWKTSTGASGAFPLKGQPFEYYNAAHTWEHWRQSVRVWAGLSLVFSVLVLFTIFTGAEPHATRGFSGIPTRRFTLPVRTATLVLCPALVGSAGAVGLWLGWAFLVFQPLMAPGKFALPVLYFGLLLPAVLTWFQTIVWGLPSFPKIRMTAILLLILGVVPVLTVMPFEAQDSGRVLAQWQAPFLAGFGVAWAAGLAAAVLGVRLERHGTWASRMRLSVSALFARDLFGRPFRSAFGAQFWMEWRQNCRVPLLVWSVLIWIALTAPWLWSTTDIITHQSVQIVAVLCAAACAIVAGLNVGRDGLSKKPAMSTFTATRPVNTGLLFGAKLLSGLALWAAGALILAVSAEAITRLSTGHWFELPPRRWAAPATVAALSLHVFVGILPVNLSGRVPGFPWTLGPLVLIYAGILSGLTWLQNSTPYDTSEILFRITIALVAVKLAVAIWGFRHAVAKRLLSRRFVGMYLLCWMVGTAFLLWLAALALEPQWRMTHRSVMPPDIPHSMMGLMFAFMVLVLPLARIAWSPLAVAMNRHR